MIKPYEELLLQDDFLFELVMNDEYIAKLVLNKLLHRDIKQLSIVKTQEIITSNVFSKGIRLDVYFEGDDELYNIEMQIGNKNLLQRVRYYQSVLDMHLLKKGQKYDKLKNTYIIFICAKDPFGLGRYKYEVEQKIEDIAYIDGTHKIFYNCVNDSKIPESEKEVGEFLKYIVTGEDNNLETNFVRELDTKVKTVKGNKEKKSMYYETFAEGIEEARIEALAEGERKGMKLGEQKGMKLGEQLGMKLGEQLGERKAKTEVARNLLGKMDDNTIASVSGLPLSDVKKLWKEK